MKLASGYNVGHIEKVAASRAATAGMALIKSAVEGLTRMPAPAFIPRAPIISSSFVDNASLELAMHSLGYV